MEAYIVEWLNILGRWVHFITGIAWIGSSFYFVWLDNHLEAPKNPADDEKGVGGELWSVHGGSFYHAQTLPGCARSHCRKRCTGSSGRRTRPG